MTRRSPITVALLVIALAVPNAARAQAVASQSPWAASVAPHRVVIPSQGALNGLQAQEAAAVLASETPYRTDWRRAGLVVTVAGAGLVLAEVLGGDDQVPTSEELAGFERDDVLRFDRPATRRYSPDLISLSQAIRSPLALAPLGLLLDPRVRSSWRSLGVMYVQTTLLSAAAPGIAKQTIRRYRPFVYNTDLSPEERLKRDPGGSFFSRTTTTAFASAVFLATVIGDHRPESAFKPLVWGAALGTAGTVGYLRFASGVHYPTDVLMGAAVGTTIGLLVPRMHRDEDEPPRVTAGWTGDGAVIVSAHIRF